MASRDGARHHWGRYGLELRVPFGAEGSAPPCLRAALRSGRTTSRVSARCAFSVSTMSGCPTRSSRRSRTRVAVTQCKGPCAGLLPGDLVDYLLEIAGLSDGGDKVCVFCANPYRRPCWHPTSCWPSVLGARRPVRLHGTRTSHTSRCTTTGGSLGALRGVRRGGPVFQWQRQRHPHSQTARGHHVAGGRR